MIPYAIAALLTLSIVGSLRSEPDTVTEAVWGSVMLAAAFLIPFSMLTGAI